MSFEFAPGDNPTTTYSDIQQFIQGQHTIPPGIEQRIAGMHSRRGHIVSSVGGRRFWPVR